MSSLTATHPLAGYQVGHVGLFTPRSLPRADLIDPAEARGILWQWELPRRDATYVLACDPTVGIINWSRTTRTRDDLHVDNAAIEVIRVGRTRIVIGPDGKQRAVSEPDVQVAECAAPIDPTTCAHVMNAIGKMYRGDSEDEGCLIQFEVGPGPGIAVFPELYSRLGYTHIFQQPYLDSPRPKRQIDYGFWSTQQSKTLLWSKGIRHLTLGGLRINSPWLLEEAIDANSDKFVFKTIRSGPTHDDRFTAILLAIWAAHSWSMDLSEVEETHLQPIVTGQPDFQHQLVTADYALHKEAEWFDHLLDLAE